MMGHLLVACILLLCKLFRPLIASKNAPESKTSVTKLESSFAMVSQSMGNIHSSSSNEMLGAKHTKMNNSAVQLNNSGSTVLHSVKRMKEGRSKSMDVTATLLEDNEEAGEAENFMFQSVHQNGN